MWNGNHMYSILKVEGEQQLEEQTDGWETEGPTQKLWGLVKAMLQCRWGHLLHLGLLALPIVQAASVTKH